MLRCLRVIVRQQSRLRPSLWIPQRSQHAPTGAQWSVLPNGVRVISEECPTPLACVALICETGPRYEDYAYHGITHFVEHLAYKGFSTVRRHALENDVRGMGAKLFVTTKREYQIFTALCSNECVPTIVKYFADICKGNLLLDTMELTQEKDAIKEEIAEEENDPHALTFYYLHQTAFQGTTLAQSVIGRWQNYKHFNGRSVKSYIANNYQPCRLILSVRSIYDHKGISSYGQQELGCIKQKVKASGECCPGRYTGSEARYRNDDMPFAYVAIAVEAFGYNSENYLTLQLIKHLLGRWDQSQCQGYDTWPLLAHACELSKLAAHYETFYLPYRDVGLFGIYLIMSKETDMEDAILMVQDQWMSLSQLVRFQDIQRAGANLKLELASKAANCLTSTHDMGLQMMYFNRYQSYKDLRCAVDEISTEDVRKLADSIFYDRCQTMAAVGPTESLLYYPKFRAGMYWLRT